MICLFQTVIVAVVVAIVNLRPFCGEVYPAIPIFVDRPISIPLVFVVKLPFVNVIWRPVEVTVDCDTVKEIIGRQNEEFSE